MAYYTAEQLRRRASMSMTEARSTLARESKAQYGHFNVFLSHSVLDAQVVMGVRDLLIKEGLTVYIDWIEDPQLDRSTVSPDTARLLRLRMRQCDTLIYAQSTAAHKSRWMPWELGYFDGMRNPEQVSIMPIQEGSSTFDGQEYLGLYKLVEQLTVGYGSAPFAVDAARSRKQRLQAFGTKSEDFAFYAR